MFKIYLIAAVMFFVDSMRVLMDLGTNDNDAAQYAIDHYPKWGLVLVVTAYTLAATILGLTWPALMAYRLKTCGKIFISW